jgi:hypothetical protein
MITAYGTPPNYRQPNPDPAPEISAGQRLMALRANATHISADGRFIYQVRSSSVKEAEWRVAAAEYGAWWRVARLPEGVVEL